MTLRVYLGYDSQEPAAFHVALHSIMRHASRPVEIVPLVQSQLRAIGMYTRVREVTEATEFSLTRFLCPALSNYEGYSLFMDCDVLVQADVYDLMLYPVTEPDKAVFVCQHDYLPKGGKKMQGVQQTSYPRKNWTSVMLLDNAKCRVLTPEYVNKATGLMLHRFWWMDDAQIGSLPQDWNHLVGEFDPNPNAKILHYTLGGPWFEAHANVDHADLWLAERDAMMGALVEAHG